MKTKEQIIQEAYEVLNIPFNEYILYDNGWTKIKPGQFYSKYDDLDLSFEKRIDIDDIYINIIKNELGGDMDALSLKEIMQIKKITGDEDVKVLEENITPIYECDCSKEHMSEGLAKIGKEELEDIINKDGKAELVCHFCNKKYEFSKEELEGILKNIC